MGERYNLPLPEGHFEKGFGKRNEEIIPEILGWATERSEIQRLADLKEETYRELIRTEGIEPLPGVRTFLAALKSAGIHAVVGSSTPRGNLDVAMEIMNLHSFFVDAVSGDDVTHGKPDPEVFVSGAAKVGCAPSEGLVLEDAFVGIAAAKAGGIPVIGVATTHPIEALHEADAAVHSLTQLAVIDGCIQIMEN